MGNLRLSQRRYDDALEPLRQADTILTRLAEDFPDRARYRKKLAKTYLGLGTARAKVRKPDEAEDYWQRGRKLLAELLGDDPGEAEYQADLGRCLGNLGWLRLGRKDLAEARLLLEEAVRYLGAAHHKTPGRLDYQRDLRSHLQSLAETLVQAGDRPAAVKAAADLAAVFPDQPLGYYYAACFVARCASLAEREGSTEDAARHAGQAAELLRQALARGLRGDERLADEESIFRPLAARPEFAGLLDELKARSRPSTAARGG
jgi:tetratricopeptide (TPR) repeat protein